MFYILGWVLYGLVIGIFAKLLHPGEDPIGFLPTVGIGIAGSFVGGGLQWLMNMGGPFSPAGFFWGIIGGIIFCFIYRKYRLNQFFKAQGRMPSNVIHKQ